MNSYEPQWREEWFRDGPRDTNGTAWWVYYEGPTRRWLAYGLHRGEADRSIPLVAKTFEAAVLEMFEKTKIDRSAYEASYWKRLQDREKEAEARKKKHVALTRKRQKLRDKLGLGPVNGPRLSSEVPFANHAIDCPLCGVKAGEPCLTLGGKKKHTVCEYVRSAAELQFQDPKSIARQIEKGSYLRFKKNFPCYLRVIVSHRERRELHPFGRVTELELGSSRQKVAGLLPASVGIASILSLDEE